MHTVLKYIIFDDVYIFSLMRCIAGSGYKLIFNPPVLDNKQLILNAGEIDVLSRYITAGIPGATLQAKEVNLDAQLVYTLPFSRVSQFGDFFLQLEANLENLKVATFGVSLPTLEDVFLKIGADETVRPRDSVAIEGIGSERRHKANFQSQVIGLIRRKLTYAKNDFTTIPLLLLPSVAAIAATTIYSQEVLSTEDWLNDFLTIGIYVGAYLVIPGLISEFLVRERENRLRNVLTISGCDISAYWLGSFIADYILLMFPTFVIFITWFAAGLSDFYSSMDGAGLPFLVVMLFNAQIISFSYISSYLFSTPKGCIAFMPMFVIFLIF